MLAFLRTVFNAIPWQRRFLRDSKAQARSAVSLETRSTSLAFPIFFFSFCYITNLTLTQFTQTFQTLFCHSQGQTHISFRLTHRLADLKTHIYLYTTRCIYLICNASKLIFQLSVCADTVHVVYTDSNTGFQTSSMLGFFFFCPSCTECTAHTTHSLKSSLLCTYNTK